MKKQIVVGFEFLVGLLLAACGGTSDAQSPGTPSATRQTLSAVGDCTFAACGSVPASLAGTASVSCANEGTNADACAWSGADPSATTSYRPCAASECPPAPALDCPAGTVHASQQCGSVNDAACTWTTSCAPPRDTTPCPDANGCGAEPDLGVICSDGTNGALACVTDGKTCRWERNCD